MQTPATAMLWELWRLTRLGMALRVSIAVLAGLAALGAAGAFGERDQAATVVLLVLVIWLPLSGGWSMKGMDNRVGFPLYLGYARPVPTCSLVGVPMAYLGVSCAVSYLVPAVVLRTVFDIPFPLAPLAGVLAAATVVAAAGNWWTHNEAIQAAGRVVFMGCVFLVYRALHPDNLPGNDFPPARWPEMFAFSVADYGLIVVLAAGAIGLTMLGVERQRRGEDTSIFRWGGGARGWSAAAPGWHVDRWLRCPTSSATQAQVWLELRQVTLAVLSSAVVTAVAIPLLFFVVNAYRWNLAFGIAMATPLLPLVTGLRRMLGLGRKQGTTYLSVFDATRPLGTAWLVGLKTLVAVLSILGAWVVLGASLWLSLPLLGDVLDPTRIRRGIVAAVDTQPGYRLGGLAAIAVVQFSTLVAYRASTEVWWVLSPWRVILWTFGLVVYALAAGIAVAWGWAGASFVEMHAWLVAALIPMGTVYVFRQALADRILTPRATGAALVMWAGFAAICLVLLRDSGTLPPDVSPALMALMASSTLVPLAAVALAPWSFSLIRHR